MNPTRDEILDAVATLPWKTINGKEGVYYGDLISYFHADTNPREQLYIKQSLLSLKSQGDIALLCMDPPDDCHIISIRLND